jgi:hypothetical protein
MSAFDNFTVPKTLTAPVIDGKLDDTYVKFHSFYDTDQFLTATDENKSGKGTVYLTYDDKNLYVYMETTHDTYAPLNDPYVNASGSCMYLAILATLPEAFDVNSQIQLAINLSETGTQEWKYTASVPADAKDNSVDKLLYDKPPFDFMVIRDEKTKTTYYEVALPWTQLDRTGKISFKEGHQFTFDYIVVTDPPITIQYGQGLMNDIYDGGAILTLGAAPVVAEPEPEPAEESPETSDTAVVFELIALGLSAVTIFVILRKKSAKI